MLKDEENRIELMPPAELRKQAWDFFQMQAAQRLTTFNFYIALSSLLSGGLIASLKADIKIPFLGILLGLLLFLLSFVFSKLDNRNRELIRSAEEVLKFFEKQSALLDEGAIPHVAKRFLREDFDTTNRQTIRSWRFWRNHYSYSQCFRIVFVTFAVLGVLGAAYSVFFSATQR